MAVTDPWTRYRRSLPQAMAQVLEEVPDELRPHVLETADLLAEHGPPPRA